MQTNKMPYSGKDHGIIGLLLDTQSNIYGKNRVNLFYKDHKLTKKLLIDYLKFRNKNINKYLNCSLVMSVSIDLVVKIKIG